MDHNLTTAWQKQPLPRHKSMEKSLIVKGLSCAPVLNLVATSFDVGTTHSSDKTCLSNLHWRLLLNDAPPQQLNVLLHLKDLLQNLNG